MFNIPPRKRFLYLKQQDFVEIEGVSIDYLVMERAGSVAMVETNFDWMDVGTLECSFRIE
ncbi:hypothetical protein IHO40_01155 [Wolbachia endosymbiont of Mansonella ozzardi]|uniref:hypothetical protein n=1 Tax=Wolbachia endosymbiont of Mansonella ozzardi TaxID=137464 RepID=UPI001CE0E04E|nr:hypothetical protein [Wolbachia endosymbiont of Mansonella ozzardi]MCA4774780.1 hypothetical protein [Wolbachia endosymbiont of Mansonella ozzardi]